MKKNQDCFQVKKLKNLASDIDMLRKSTDSYIEAVEYDEQHIAFEVDNKSCSKNQLVSVDGVIHLSGKDYDFSASGKIVDIVPLGEGRVKVVLDLHSCDKKLWKKFVTSLKENQAKLDKLFNSMKDEF